MTHFLSLTLTTNQPSSAPCSEAARPVRRAGGIFRASGRKAAVGYSQRVIEEMSTVGPAVTWAYFR